MIPRAAEISSTVGGAAALVVLKLDEIDILAGTMLGDLDERDHAGESRTNCERGRDIRDGDAANRSHLDVA